MTEAASYQAELDRAFRDFEDNSPLEVATVLSRRAWEGSVDEIEDEWFGAHLKPARGDAEEGHGAWEYLQVADHERELIQPGGLFWLLAETVRRADGHVEVRSQVRFRLAGDDD